MNSYDDDNGIYGGYGQFDTSSTAGWTDADWDAYYAEMAEAEAAEEAAGAEEYEELMLAEAAGYEEAEWNDWQAEAAMSYYDDDPSPYAGDYSEM